MGEPGEVTRLLQEFNVGDRTALDRLLPLVYDELKQIASGRMKGERSEHTLQPTALVHEAYMRLVGLHQIEWRDRAHFFAVAAGAIRRVLVDHARRRSRIKRSGERDKVPFDEGLAIALNTDLDVSDVLELDAALQKLSQEAPDKARVVEMRFFSGLTHDEIAAVLETSRRTIDRHWRFARAWLFRELSDEDGEPTGDASA